MTGPRIGFACLWSDPPEATWSYTPWHLRESMRRLAPVRDVGVGLSKGTDLVLKAAHARWRGGRLVSDWQQSRLTDAVCQRAIRRGCARERCDAVFQIQDLAVPDVPFFLLQDMSFDALLNSPEEVVSSFLPHTRATLHRRMRRQRIVYERAAGVFAMSHWLARSLVTDSGLRPDQVHVVHPGISAVSDVEEPLPVREGPRRRLLFVGRDFFRKGGDLVVAALAQLRREVDPSITLTVVGPAVWPLPGDVPAGVDFRGTRPLQEIVRLYDSHDLFVMPSRFEAFGIVFAEAAARGLPCIARDAYAMPEVITPGVTGALVRGDDPVELAQLVASVLADDSLYAKCRDAAGAVRDEFSWERAGRQVVDTISRTVQGSQV